VSQHIVGQEEVCLNAFCPQLPCTLLGEEGTPRLNSLLPGRPGRFLGWIDAEHRNVPLGEVAKHVAVVAPRLQDEALRVEVARLNQVQGALPEVLEQGRGD